MKLTPEAKDEGLEKWSFRAKDIKEARKWWRDIGEKQCYFCHLFGLVGNVFYMIKDFIVVGNILRYENVSKCNRLINLMPLARLFKTVSRS